METKMRGRFKKKREKLNNKGFSLLELIIVIAIIAVVTVATMIGITVLSKGNAKKMNKNLYSAISELKTSTMAKSGTWRMTIGKSGNEYVINTYKDAEVIESYSCSASRIKIKYDYEDNPDSAYSLDDNTLEIVFSRDDGSCKSVKAVEKDEELKSKALSGEFIISASGQEYKSKIWYATGRVTTSN